MSNDKLVVIYAEVFSSNLGDGVIAETLELLLHGTGQGVVVRKMDMSGRPDFRVSRLTSKATRRGLSRMPWLSPPKRNFLRWLVRIVRERDVDRLPEDTSLVVFGGGQLLMDNHLRFPLDLLRLAIRVRARNVPLAIHACGVGGQWSPTARWLVRYSVRIGKPVSISVRDTQSRERLCEILDGVEHVPITRTIDPGVWAGDIVETVRADVSDRCIGLAVMDPHKISNVRPKGSALPARHEVLEFWVALARLINHRGWVPVFFTNGAPGDELFTTEVVTRLSTEWTGEPFWERAGAPTSPAELTVTVGSFTGVIAFRLHAAIVSFSQGVPAISINWDSKVASFNEAVGRSRWTVQLDELCSQLVFKRLEMAIDEGVKADALEAAKGNIKRATELLIARPLR